MTLLLVILDLLLHRLGMGFLFLDQLLLDLLVEDQLFVEHLGDLGHDLLTAAFDLFAVGLALRSQLLKDGGQVGLQFGQSLLIDGLELLDQLGALRASGRQPRPFERRPEWPGAAAC